MECTFELCRCPRLLSKQVSSVTDNLWTWRALCGPPASTAGPADCEWRALQVGLGPADEDTLSMDVTKTTDEEVVELINDAIAATNDKTKVSLLQKVQELVIHHDLLDNFLEEVVGFQSDKSVEVRKFVISFMEKSCSKDPDCFPKLILNFKIFLEDENVNVVKKCVQSLTLLYKTFLVWISKAKNIDEQMDPTWEVWKQIKGFVLDLFETTDNEGVKTQCIKFMETVVICQSKADKWTPPEDEVNVSQLEHVNLWTINEIIDEGDLVFKQLIVILGTPHISSVNLMACMQSLVTIAKLRSQTYMLPVVKALETLNCNLPPTLGKSQVSSVRKQLKLQLLILLKHPLAASTQEYQSIMVELLNELGATPNEIAKCFQEVRKRGIKVEMAPVPTKRIKLEPEVRKEPATPELTPKVNRTDAIAALDSTTSDIASKLEKLENVTDLVLVSLLNLPDVMPPYLPALYNPARGRSKSEQITNLSRLLASQITLAGLGVGVDQVLAKNEIDVQRLTPEKRRKLASFVGLAIAHEAKKQENQEKAQEKSPLALKLAPTGKAKVAAVKVKHTNWTDITKPFDGETRDSLIKAALERILSKEEVAQKFTQEQAQKRLKVIAHLSNVLDDSATDTHTQMILEHAMSDLRARHEIILNLVNDWYTNAKEKDDMPRYSKNLVKLVRLLMTRAESKDKEQFLQKVLAEAPQVPEEVVLCFKEHITTLSAESLENSISLIASLAKERSSIRSSCILLLIDLCICDKQETRQLSIRSLQQLHSGEIAELKKSIEEHCLAQLSSLQNTQDFEEETIKLHLVPFLSLLPQAHSLVHELANIYVSTPAEVKRVILRCLEVPVKSMGMNSPDLLRLVESCPKGAETLVTRMIHVLTDKQAPSAELVARVKDLYYNRVSDVRFLIPILNGLTKKEVVAALPQLIQLNPVVVKEVFNRLLGIHHVDSSGSYPSSLSPAELLVALHNIDQARCDMKTIIKATSMCFQEKNIYTQEVLAVVIQLLVDQTPLPTLLMRTVIQSLSLYPRLLGFVMNTLQRLIPKQVWKQKKVWEGFIKCCQQTKPQSFQVLLQLPVPQLNSVFAAWPDLKQELQTHLTSLEEAQRIHISKSVMDAIFDAN